MKSSFDKAKRGESMSTEYRIVDDFQAGESDLRVLVLDRPYEFSGADRLTIDGKEYRPALCSIRDWVIVQSRDSFRGKIAVFS